MISLLGSRVRLRSLALTRQDTKAKSCYLNPSSQLSKLVLPILTVLKNISHKQNDAAASQTKKKKHCLPSIHCTFGRSGLKISRITSLYWDYPLSLLSCSICYLLSDQTNPRSFDIVFIPKFKKRRYFWLLKAKRLLIILKIKNKNAIRLIRISFLSRNTGLAIF